MLEGAALAGDNEVCGKGVTAVLADVGAGDCDAELAKGGDQHQHARSGRGGGGLAGDGSAIDADSDAVEDITRTLLHVAIDWPGHYPNGAAIIGVLVAAGAEVNARFAGPHTVAPLHWAASSDDLEVLDALLDAGADIEAPGAVLGGGRAACVRGGAARTLGRRAADRGGKAPEAGSGSGADVGPGIGPGPGDGQRGERDGRPAAAPTTSLPPGGAPA